MVIYGNKNAYTILNNNIDDLIYIIGEEINHPTADWARSVCEELTADNTTNALEEELIYMEEENHDLMNGLDEIGGICKDFLNGLETKETAVSRKQVIPLLEKIVKIVYG